MSTCSAASSLPGERMEHSRVRELSVKRMHDSSTRILVVDDENGPRQALRMLLKEEHEIVLAEDVLKAINLLSQETFNLVIADLRMPGLTGIDLLHWTHEHFPEIPVIILTGYSQLETAVKAVQFGAFVYLEKPFDSEIVLNCVASALRKNRDECERRAMEHLAIEANRFETVGRVMTGIMHDMGTPLSVIAGQVEMMLKNAERPDMVDRLEMVQSQVGYCAEMVRMTMGFLRQPTNTMMPFGLNDVVKLCLELAGPNLRNLQIVVNLDLAAELGTALGDIGLVRQCVLNLITNAAAAMAEQTPGGRELNIRTWQEEEELFVSVADTGPGVPNDLKGKIFETFFTTKGQSGTGLGLSVVRNVMRRHRGNVWLDESIPGGACFVLQFPVATTHDLLDAMRNPERIG